MRPSLAFLLVAPLLLVPLPARAAGPLGVSGSPITTSQYTIDFFTGPVVSSARVMGLGGAYAGIAEGVDADAVNPAAPAVRIPWSYDWFDYDLSLGLSLPGLFSGTDFDNSDDPRFRYDSVFVPNVGLNLMFGPTALGITADLRRYKLDFNDSTPTRYYATLGSLHLLLARAFWRGQFTVGAGLRIAIFDLNEQGTGGRQLFSLSVVTGETGFLIAPTGYRFRIGVSARLPGTGSPILDSNAVADGRIVQKNGDVLFNGAGSQLYLPSFVTIPWEIEAGVAIELGNRPLNPEWINPREWEEPLRREIAHARSQREVWQVPDDAERAWRYVEEKALDDQADDLHGRRRRAFFDLPRRRYLLTASVLVTGPVANAVGAIGFLAQTVKRSGENASVTPRLGLEAEPFANWLQLRAGTYLEPARLSGTSMRLHGTLGFDVKVLPWDVFGLYPEGTWWSVGTVVDFADRYANASFRLAVWH